VSDKTAQSEQNVVADDAISSRYAELLSARQNLGGESGDEDRGVLHQLILFKLSSKRVAMAIEHLREVVPLPKIGGITPIPTAPEYVMGLGNLRGRVLTLIDLHGYLGMGRVTNSELAKVLVVYEGKEQLGILVEEVEDIVEASDRDIHPGEPSLHPDLKNLLDAEVMRDGGLTPMVDLTRMLR